jgi:hypothetical protein
MATKRALFEFFAGKQRSSTPHTVATIPALRHFGAGNGPVEDAFGSPILIVEGTTGSADERAVVHDLAEELENEWRQDYFVECPVKLDTQITDNDLQQYNLVIVGDEATNLVAKRFKESLPLQQKADGILLAGKGYSGDQIGYEFVAPNLSNPHKYVVVIGMNKWHPVSAWRLHPWRDGVYDYVVFDVENSGTRIVGTGYFDPSVWGSAN